MILPISFLVPVLQMLPRLLYLLQKEVLLSHGTSYSSPAFLPFIFFIIMLNRMKEHYRFLLNKEIYNKNRKLRWY